MLVTKTTATNTTRYWHSGSHRRGRAREYYVNGLSVLGGRMSNWNFLWEIFGPALKAKRPEPRPWPFR